MPQVASVAEWDSLQSRMRALAPEAFKSEGRALN
jgi:hypothetical protein